MINDLPKVLPPNTITFEVMIWGCEYQGGTQTLRPQQQLFGLDGKVAVGKKTKLSEIICSVLCKENQSYCSGNRTLAVETSGKTTVISHSSFLAPGQETGSPEQVNPEAVTFKKGKKYTHEGSKCMKRRTMTNYWSVII